MINWDFISSLDFSYAWEYRAAIFQGFLLTLSLTAVATIVGLVAGTMLAIFLQSPLGILRWAVIAYVELLRNTPLLVQLIWIHFALPHFTGFSTTALQSGVIGLSLNTAAYYTEIVRAGIQSVPSGQREAADALGLSSKTKWMRVILPQAIKIIVPPITSLMIGVFKGTSVLSILAINELMRVTNTISNFTFKPVELITTAAVVYFLTGWALTWLSAYTERRFRRSER